MQSWAQGKASVAIIEDNELNKVVLRFPKEKRNGGGGEYIIIVEQGLLQPCWTSGYTTGPSSSVALTFRGDGAGSASQVSGQLTFLVGEQIGV